MNGAKISIDQVTNRQGETDVKQWSKLHNYLLNVSLFTILPIIVGFPLIWQAYSEFKWSSQFSGPTDTKIPLSFLSERWMVMSHCIMVFVHVMAFFLKSIGFDPKIYTFFKNTSVFPEKPKDPQIGCQGKLGRIHHKEKKLQDALKSRKSTSSMSQTVKLLALVAPFNMIHSDVADITLQRDAVLLTKMKKHRHRKDTS